MTRSESPRPIVHLLGTPTIDANNLDLNDQSGAEPHVEAHFTERAVTPRVTTAPARSDAQRPSQPRTPPPSKHTFDLQHPTPSPAAWDRGPRPHDPTHPLPTTGPFARGCRGQPSRVARSKRWTPSRAKPLLGGLGGLARQGDHQVRVPPRSETTSYCSRSTLTAAHAESRSYFPLREARSPRDHAHS